MKLMTALVSAACSVLCVVATATEVTVAVTTLHSIAGETVIPKGIFGGTTFSNFGNYATADLEDAKLANEARLGMIRILPAGDWGRICPKSGPRSCLRI